MYFETKRKVWRVLWTSGGKRYSRNYHDPKEAKRFVRELDLGEVSVETPGGSPTFREFTERWLKEYCRVEKAESQWRRDQLMIERHLMPLLGDRRLSELKKSHLVEVKVALKATLKRKRIGVTLAPKTVNKVLSTARKMLSTAVDMDLIAANPWSTVKLLKVPERVFDYWTGGELAVFEAMAFPISPEMTRLVATAFHTGLRAGELAALQTEDLDFASGQIRIRATVCLSTGQRYEQTKNRRVEYVPMNQAVRDALEPARFLSRGKSVFSPSHFWNLRKKFGRLAKKVGSRPIRFHDLRHSFASNLAMGGVDLMRIQRLMRHQSYQMTLRYAHLHPDHMKGATDVLCTQPARNDDRVPKSGAPRGT
jgi:integrase